MAWGFVQTFPGVTLEDYEKVSEKLGDDVPEGAIFHAAGLYNGSLRVMEVWESQAHYERFRNEQLGPVVAAVMGEPPPGASEPVMEAMDVHTSMSAP